jgi:cytochrome c553
MFKHFLFAILSFSILFMIGVFAYRDVAAEWKGYQSTYNEKLAKVMNKPEVANKSLRVEQIWNGVLNRTDRCTTCHAGIGNPAFENEPQPYKTHPNLMGYMSKHPFEKVGCTVCHDGDGQALTVEKTHGVVHHLDRQLKTKSTVQAACSRCHSDLYAEGLYWPEVPELMKGISLARELGCGACHTINQLGTVATMAPELSGMGSKTELAFYLVHDFSKMKSHEHTMKAWEFEHFKDPQKIVPGTMDAKDPKDRIPSTIMPNWGLSDDEAMALTVFVMSLRDPKVEAIPRKYLPKITSHDTFFQYRN